MRKKSIEEEAVCDECPDRASKLELIRKLRSSMLNKDGDLLIRTMKDVDRSVRVFSTRIPSLDIALGVGGIPRGRITEFYGPERAGKTTAALQVAASAQQQGGVILYIDSEHSLDPDYCAALGLDLNDPGFLIVQEDSADEALNGAIQMLSSGVIDIVIIDSLANMIPSSTEDQFKEKGVGKAVVGAKARLLTNFMEMAVGRVHKTNAAMLCLQQLRTIMKPGQQVRESTPSPNSVRHNTSIRVKISRKKDNVPDGLTTDETLHGVSQESIAKVEKNKVAPPFRQALYTIEYGKGALYWDDLVDCCVIYGVPNVQQGKKFAFFDDDGVEIGKAYRKGIHEWMNDHTDLACLLVDKLSDRVGIHLWDPIRQDRAVGPYTAEELSAVSCEVLPIVAEAEDILDSVDEDLEEII